MVRILFNEELHFLKKRAVVKLTKSELKRRIVKKCLDK
jgi:aromatic ring-opening dioxygenase LigB subunit